MIYWILAGLLMVLSFFMDKGFSSLVFSLRNSVLDLIFKYFYLLLKDYVLLIVNVILLCFRDKRKIINAVIGFLSTGVIITILKYFIGRMRPFEVIENAKIEMFDYNFASFNSSFPSWHTGAVFSLLPFAFYINRKFGYFWILIGVLEGVTRVYTGYHYLSDVLFGGLIGYLIGLLFFNWKSLNLR